MCYYLYYHDFSDLPSAPEKLTVTETSKSSISLSWSPPTSDGGSPVTGYHVERCLAGSSRWLRVGKSETTSYTDKEVVEDTEYQYQVSAENKVGVGPPSEPTQPVTAKDPWSKFRSVLQTRSLIKPTGLNRTMCCHPKTSLIAGYNNKLEPAAKAEPISISLQTSYTISEPY